MIQCNKVPLPWAHKALDPHNAHHAPHLMPYMTQKLNTQTHTHTHIPGPDQRPEYRYHLAAHGVRVGDVLMGGVDAPITPGSILKLRDIPLGQPIHNLEMVRGGGEGGQGGGVSTGTKPSSISPFPLPTSLTAPCPSRPPLHALDQEST